MDSLDTFSLEVALDDALKDNKGLRKDILALKAQIETLNKWNRATAEKSTFEGAKSAARIAALEAALRQISKLSEKSDDWEPSSDYPDIGNYGDFYSHGLDEGAHEAAMVARAALKEGSE